MPIRAVATSTYASGSLLSATAEPAISSSGGAVSGAGLITPDLGGTVRPGGVTGAAGSHGAKRKMKTKEDEAGRLRTLVETLQHPPYDFNDRSVRVDEELKKQTQAIANAQTNIEALEKKYKESVLLRRVHQNASQLFPSDTTLAPPTGDPIEDFLIKAREVLRQQKASVQAENEKLAQIRIERQQALQRAIANTRTYFKEQQRLVEQGPKFLFHFSTGFGNVTFVDAVKSDIYMIITSGATIEIWQTNEVSGEVQASPISITTFPTGRIMKIEPTGVLDETPKPTVNFTKDEDETAGFTASAKDRGVTVVPARGDSAGPGSTHPDYSFADASRPSTVGDIGSRPTTGVGFDESSTLEQSWPKTLAAISISTSTNMDDGENAVDAPQLAPFTITRRLYFVGTEAGTGCLLTLLVTEERQTGKTEYELSLSQEVAFSQQPVRQAVFTAHNNQLVAVVADVPGALKTYALLALDIPSLNPLWRVPVDRMDQRATGHIAQILVTPLQVPEFASRQSTDLAGGSGGCGGGGGPYNSSLSVFTDSAGTGRNTNITPPDDPNCKVTAVAYDPHNATLLVALRSGRVVRVTHETIVMTTEPPHEPEGGNLEPQLSDTGVTEGAWSDQPKATFSLPAGSRKAAPVAEEVRQEVSLSILFAVDPQIQPSLMSVEEGSITPDGKPPEIYSMVTFLHPISDTASLLLGCRDGSVRVVSVDHATVGQEMFFNVVEDFATPAEQAVDNSVGYIYLGENAAFIMSYTSIGTFTIFNLVEPSAPRVASIRVLVSRHAFENHSSSESQRQASTMEVALDRDSRAFATPAATNFISSARSGKARTVRVFPKQDGSVAALCLSTENEWSLVRLDSLATYLREHSLRTPVADAR